MQEHIAKHLRISILIWLMLLSLAFPYLVHYYEQQRALQWEAMVQPHWQTIEYAPPTDVAESTNLETVTLDNSIAETAVEKTASENIQGAVMPVPAEPVKTTPNKQIKKLASQKKNSSLHFRLPEDLYHGRAAEWHEKKPLVMPDLFAPKKESERVQLGGRLIMDEDTKTKPKEEDAGYLDSLQGAEVNISIKVR